MIELRAQRSSDVGKLAADVLADELRERVKDLQQGCSDILLDEIEQIISELARRASCDSKREPATP